MGSITLEDIKELLKKQTETLVNQFQVSIKGGLGRIEKLERRCLNIERKQRKNNVIIFGLNTDRDHIVKKTIDTLNELLDLDFSLADVNDIYQIGKSEKKPVIVEFKSFLKKREIFQNKDKLRALKNTGIAVANDLCEQDRQVNKVLRKHMSAARNQGKKARISGGKLQIDGDWFTVEELETGEEFSGNEESEASDESDADGEQEQGSQVVLLANGKETKRGIPGCSKSVKSGKAGKRKSQVISPHVACRTRTKKKKGG